MGETCTVPDARQPCVRDEHAAWVLPLCGGGASRLLVSGDGIVIAHVCDYHAGEGVPCLASRLNRYDAAEVVLPYCATCRQPLPTNRYPGPRCPDCLRAAMHVDAVNAQTAAVVALRKTQRKLLAAIRPKELAMETTGPTITYPATVMVMEPSQLWEDESAKQEHPKALRQFPTGTTATITGPNVGLVYGCFPVHPVTINGLSGFMRFTRAELSGARTITTTIPETKDNAMTTPKTDPTLLDRAASVAQTIGLDDMAIIATVRQVKKLVKEPLIAGLAARLKVKAPREFVKAARAFLSSDLGDAALSVSLGGIVRFAPFVPEAHRERLSRAFIVDGGAAVMDLAMDIVMGPVREALSGASSVLSDPNVTAALTGSSPKITVTDVAPVAVPASSTDKSPWGG